MFRHSHYTTSATGLQVFNPGMSAQPTLLLASKCSLKSRPSRSPHSHTWPCLQVCSATASLSPRRSKAPHRRPLLTASEASAASSPSACSASIFSKSPVESCTALASLKLWRLVLSPSSIYRKIAKQSHMLKSQEPQPSQILTCEQCEAMLLACQLVWP